MNTTQPRPTWSQLRPAALLPKAAVLRAPASTARRAVPWLLLLVALGLGIRSYHYLVDPPVWHDEAALICNVLHKEYGEMLGPLYYSEASPPLFLAAEKAVVAVLGDGTFALRLIPFLAGCVSLVVLVALGRRLLPRQSLLWFALLAGCSVALVWHCTEAKPYSVDLLVATGLLVLLVPYRSADRASNRLLAVLTLLTPLLLFSSFPSLFLLGGVALTLLPSAWRGRSNRWWYAAFVVVLGSSFLLLYFTVVQSQRDADLLACWNDWFPPWDRPWLLPTVALERFTNIFRYAAEPSGNLLFPLAVVGAVSWWRSGKRWLVGILAWPLALNAVAWLMGSYPMDATRVVLYAAPAALLLIAAGIAPTWAWLTAKAPWARVGLVILLLVPAANIAFTTFVKPLKRRDSATPVEFVLAHRQADEPVVGILWEQYYYCRRLGPYYRALFPARRAPETPLPTVVLDAEGKPTGQSVRSLWLLTIHDRAGQANQVGSLQPGGAWRILERYPFRDVTVLHVGRD